LDNTASKKHEATMLAKWARKKTFDYTIKKLKRMDPDSLSSNFKNAITVLSFLVCQDLMVEKAHLLLTSFLHRELHLSIFASVTVAMHFLKISEEIFLDLFSRNPFLKSSNLNFVQFFAQ
jgi:hypothetical protein